MKIGYVCTNFNNSSFTIQAVNSLLKNKGHEFKIVVVDNCSQPKYVMQLEELAKEFDAVHIICNDINIGYFPGLNIGIKYLTKEYPEIDWLVIGNNDLVFPCDFADRVTSNSARLREYAVVSPDIVTIDGEHQNPHVISGISIAREFFYDLYYANYYLGMLIQKFSRVFPTLSERTDEMQWEIAQPIYQGHGSCYLLGPRFFEQFEELWAPTFLMYEEFFLSKQLSDVGQQVFYDPSVQVVHHWHGSLAKLPSRQRWNIARSAHREYRKHVKVLG